MKTKTKIIYSKLTNTLDLGFVRIGGPGLANCIITSMQAFVVYTKEKEKNDNTLFINPTWKKISTGPILRKEKDKRHYFNLFKVGGVSGLLKIYYLFFKKKDLLVVEGMNDYFKTIKENHNICVDYFNSILKNKYKKEFNKGKENVVGVHIRRGDYKNTKYYTDISFFVNIIKEIQKIAPETIFNIYSDGKNKEIKEVLEIKNTRRVAGNNAIMDIISLANSKLIIGSDSTFSALAAFLKQTPIMFSSRHFDSPLLNKNKEFIIFKKDKIENYLNNIYEKNTNTQYSF